MNGVDKRWTQLKPVLYFYNPLKDQKRLEFFLMFAADKDM